MKRVFNLKFYNEYSKHINGGNSSTEIQLLNVLEDILIKQSQKEDLIETQSSYPAAYESKIQKKIKGLLPIEGNMSKKKMDQWIESEKALQIVKIIFFLQNELFYKYDVLNICGDVCSYHLSKYEYEIKEQCSITPHSQRLTEMRNQKLQQLLQNVKNLTDSIRVSAQYSGNQLELVDYLKIHEMIAPFLHLNCEQSINCTFCVEIPEQVEIESFQVSIFAALSKLQKEMYQIQEYLPQEHNILHHLSPIIFSFTMNTQLWKNEHNRKSSLQTIQPQTIQIPSLILFLSSLELLYNVLLQNHKFAIEIISEYDFIHLIIMLTKFQRKQTDENLNIDEQKAAYIREKCFDILTDAILSCEISIWKRVLFKYQYAKAIIEATALGGGSCEQNGMIRNRANSLMELFLFNNQCQRDDSEEMEQLGIQMSEAIEEEGGSEEISNGNWHYFSFDIRY